MPTIKFHSDDEERDFRYTVSTARRFKENYGKSLWRVRTKGPQDEAPEILDLECLTAVIWAGLLKGDPKITTSKVEVLLEKFFAEEGDVAALYEKIGEAFEKSGLFGRPAEASSPKAE